MIIVRTLQIHEISYLVDVSDTFDPLSKAMTEVITSIDGNRVIEPLTSYLVSEEILDARFVDNEEIHALIRETNDVFGE